MERYPDYKDVGIKWLGEIPKHWIVKRLKYISNTISKGTTPTTLGKEILSEGPIRFIKGENIIDNALNFEKSYFIDNETNDLLGRSKLLPNDILFVIAGSIGKAAIVKEEHTPANTSQAISYIRLIDNENSSFILKWLSSSIVQEYILLDTVVAAQPNLSMEDLGNIFLPYPPLPEQEAIASFLDRKTKLTDDLIDKKQRLIELKKEERAAIINQAVTKGLDPDVPMKDSGIEWLGEIPEHWEVKKLKYIASIRYGLGQPPKTLEGGLPIIRATNVKSGIIDETDLLFVDPEDVPYGRDPILELNDIIVVRSGAYTADSAIITEKYVGAVTGYDMVVKALSVNPMFLAFGFLSNYILYNQLYLHRLRAAQPHLNAEELGETNVLHPPHDEQDKIAQYLQELTHTIDLIISRINTQIDLLKEYKTTLIAEAVTGKIDVRYI